MPRDAHNAENQDWRTTVSLRIHAALDALTTDRGGLNKTTDIFIEEVFQENAPRIGRMTYFSTRKCGMDTMEVTVYFGYFMDEPEEPEVCNCWSELGFVFNLVDSNIDLDSLAMLQIQAEAPPKDRFYLAHYLMTCLETDVWVRKRKTLAGTPQSVEALMARVHDDIETEAVSELTTAE